jgi:hypothetical protein
MARSVSRADARSPDASGTSQTVERSPGVVLATEVLQRFAEIVEDHRLDLSVDQSV